MTEASTSSALTFESYRSQNMTSSSTDSRTHPLESESHKRNTSGEDHSAPRNFTGGVDTHHPQRQENSQQQQYPLQQLDKIESMHTCIASRIALAVTDTENHPPTNNNNTIPQTPSSASSASSSESMNKSARRSVLKMFLGARGQKSSHKKLDGKNNLFLDVSQNIMKLDEVSAQNAIEELANVLSPRGSSSGSPTSAKSNHDEEEDQSWIGQVTNNEQSMFMSPKVTRVNGALTEENITLQNDTVTKENRDDYSLTKEKEDSPQDPPHNATNIVFQSPMAAVSELSMTATVDSAIVARRQSISNPQLTFQSPPPSQLTYNSTQSLQYPSNATPAHVDYLTLGLSCPYSLSKHAPKYSEDELHAQIDAALSSKNDTITSQTKEMAASQSKISLLELELQNTKSAQQKQLTFKLQQKERKVKILHAEQEKALIEKHERQKISLQSQICTLQAENRNNKAEHDTQIDAVYKEFEQFVLEENVKNEEQKKLLIKGKEMIVNALGAQLIEKNDKLIELERLNVEAGKYAQQQLQEAEEQRGVVESLQREIRKNNAVHEQTMEQELSNKKIAVEKVKKEVMISAQGQFEEANKVYQQLKSDHNKEQVETQKLKKLVELEKKKGEDGLKEKKKDLLNAESAVAELKASLATAEASNAKQTQSYIIDIDELRYQLHSLQAQLQEAQNNCASSHMSLATVVLQKENSDKEAAEMRQMCEELIAMEEARTSADTSMLVE